MHELTTVMYHYVHPLDDARYPGLHAMDLTTFRRQLDYLCNEYSIVSTQEVLLALRANRKLPKKSCLLTFDDGYIDHFEYVFPELLERNITAAFFPIPEGVSKKRLIAANAVHLILTRVPRIVELRSELERHALESGISSDDLAELWAKYGAANRFDDADTIFIKRMLQHALPEAIRNSIIEKLFYDFVGPDMDSFARNFYLSETHLRTMLSAGMTVGSHGYSHRWLDRLTDDEQFEEISKGLEFLEDIGVPTKDWFMCYPFGAYNEHTKKLLKRFGAAFALTSRPGVANLLVDDPFELPRVDCNDIREYPVLKN